MDPITGFSIFMVVLLLFLATGTPVAVATGLVGILGVYLYLPHGAITQLASIAFAQSASFVLVVVPLFVMMGEALAATSIGRDLFTAAQIWLTRLPGSLAIGTVVACAIFGGPCGSSPVTAATIGSMAIPEMIKKGYAPRLAYGVTAAGGTLGILIPPSIPMVLYGVITETSIGDLFIAGIVPGILITIMLGLTVMYQVWRFIAPGLYAHEKKMVIPFVALTSAGSLGGALFSHYVLFPALMAFYGEFSSTRMKFMPGVEDTVDLYLKMMLGMVVVFPRRPRNTPRFRF